MTLLDHQPRLRLAPAAARHPRHGLARRGERVVVATGPATAAIVESFGFERVDLQLGRGSNPGVIRAEEQPDGEDDSLRGFFDATRAGMVETLRVPGRRAR